jgi:hypothetical protein
VLVASDTKTLAMKREIAFFFYDNGVDLISPHFMIYLTSKDIIKIQVYKIS